MNLNFPASLHLTNKGSGKPEFEHRLAEFIGFEIGENRVGCNLKS